MKRYAIAQAIAWCAVLVLAACGEWPSALGLALGMIAGRLL